MKFTKKVIIPLLIFVIIYVGVGIFIAINKDSKSHDLLSSWSSENLGKNLNQNSYKAVSYNSTTGIYDYEFLPDELKAKSINEIRFLVTYDYEDIHGVWTKIGTGEKYNEGVQYKLFIKVYDYKNLSIIGETEILGAPPDLRKNDKNTTFGDKAWFAGNDYVVKTITDNNRNINQNQFNGFVMKIIPLVIIIVFVLLLYFIKRKNKGNIKL